jgi:hypothetical protein
MLIPHGFQTGAKRCVLNGIHFLCMLTMSVSYWYDLKNLVIFGNAGQRRLKMAVDNQNKLKRVFQLRRYS